MDSIKIENGLKTETGRYQPIKVIFEGDECSVTELESACEKLTDRVKAATPEKPILVRWNKTTGTYEVMDNSFISDDAPIIGQYNSKTVIFLDHQEEEENCFTSALKWLTEQDWFKNSDE